MKHIISQSTNNSYTVSLPFVAGIISHPACELSVSVKQRIPASFIRFCINIYAPCEVYTGSCFSNRFFFWCSWWMVIHRCIFRSKRHKRAVYMYTNGSVQFVRNGNTGWRTNNTIWGTIFRYHPIQSYYECIYWRQLAAHSMTCDWLRMLSLIAQRCPMIIRLKAPISNFTLHIYTSKVSLLASTYFSYSDQIKRNGPELRLNF